MWKQYNPNPKAARVGDCTVRALSKVLGQDWMKTYLDQCIYGLLHADMPSANHVWGKYLMDNGFRRYGLEETCPDYCYTVEAFCKDHPHGTYLLALGSHVVAVQEGDYYDTWDSGQEVPLYFFSRE